MTIVSCAVEGDLDAAIAKRLLLHVSLQPGAVHGGMGKQHIEQNIAGYANAARFNPWFVLVDLDESPCAAGLVSKWLPGCPVKMAFRVAVRAADAWLLGDRVNLARFFGVSRDLVPRDPERVNDPKGTLVGIARRSRKRELREGVPPRPESGRAIGPLYVSELSRFAQEHWDVAAAATASSSLERCLRALAALRTAR